MAEPAGGGLPGQVLALRHAVVGGRAIDQPTGLTKVTETY